MAFKLAVRSFYKEVAYIQCNVKMEQFRHLIRNPEDVNYFEFDLMAAVKVYKYRLNCCYHYKVNFSEVENCASHRS